MLTALDIVFLIAAGALWFRNAVGRSHFGLLLVLGMHVAFYLASHMAWRMTNHTTYFVETYAISHLLLFAFLTLTTMVVSVTNSRPFDYLGSIRGVSERHLAGGFALWIVFESYLVLRYGMRGGETTYSGLDFALSSLVAQFFMGATCVYVAKLAVAPAIMFKPWLTIPFVATQTYLLAFGGSQFGGRRGLLLYALVYVTISFMSARQSRSRFSLTRPIYIIFAAIALLSATQYYQAVRTNFLDPVLRSQLESQSLDIKIEGLLGLLSPNTSSDDEAIVLASRSGPFDALYGITEGVYDFNRSTEGLVTWNGSIRALPSILGIPKAELDEDYLIGERFSLAPGQQAGVNATFFNNPDYSGSILAYSIADFGLLGLPFSVAVMVLAIIYADLAIRQIGRNPILAICGFGTTCIIAATVEGSITTFLSATRELTIIWIATAVVLLFFPAATTANASTMRRNMHSHAARAKSAARPGSTIRR